MHRVHAVVLLVLWGVPWMASAQASDPAGLLGAMEDAYERMDYTTAERRAREALEAPNLLSADQIVRAHTTLGLLLHARGEPLEARAHFAAALSLDPGLVLDPVLVSPKTLVFFETVRDEARDVSPSPSETTVRYVRVRDLRPAATVRSLAVPGWGQLYNGQRAKGWMLIGTWSALAAGTVASHIARSQAHRDYLGATTQAEIADRYDTYNAWHRRRSALALGTAAIWAYAALDALIFEGPRTEALALRVSPSGVGVALRLGP